MILIRASLALAVAAAIVATCSADVEIRVVRSDDDKKYVDADISIQTTDKTARIEEGEAKNGKYVAKMLPGEHKAVCIVVYPRDKEDRFWGSARSYDLGRGGPITIKLKAK